VVIGKGGSQDLVKVKWLVMVMVQMRKTFSIHMLEMMMHAS
jgi:hypothetical protein